MTPHPLTRIDRYVIGKFLGTYLFSIALIISIGIVFDFNENVDNFTEHHAPWQAIVFKYYVHFVPYYINLFSPLFVFLSVIFFTSKLAGDSEIIAMLSAGLSMRRLTRPYLIAAALIAGASYYLGTRVIPYSNTVRLAFDNQYKKRKKNPTYADKVQLQVRPGVIAYLEHFDGVSKTGTHFSLDRFERKRLVSHLTATTVEYDTLSDTRCHWRLNNVTIREMRGLRERITHLPRADSTIDIEPQDFLFIRNQHETMTSPRLREYIAKQRDRGSGNVRVFEVEYHKRIASPFASLVLTVIGMSLSSRKRKGGMGFSIGLGLLLSAAYILLQGVSATFSTNAGMHPALAAWLPNIIFTIIAWRLYVKASR